IARVVVEAQRHRFIVVRSLRREEWILCLLRRRLSGAICLFAAPRIRRHAGRPRILRGRRHRGQSKLCDLKRLRWSYQLADSLLGDAQLLRDRTVAHPLALQRLDAAQTFTGDTSSAAPPPFLSTERRHPAVAIALLVAPNNAHRAGKRPRHVRLLGKA